MQKQTGFTLIEVIIVMAIILLLYAFTVVNLPQTRGKVSIDTTIDQLESDIRGQQLSAMSGFDQGVTPNLPFGIYFQGTQYTLFHSAVYQVNDPANFVVALDSGTQFQNVTFPGSEIVFASTSGAINAYNAAQNSLQVYSPITNTTKIVTVNKYGALSVQ